MRRALAFLVLALATVACTAHMSSSEPTQAQLMGDTEAIVGTLDTLDANLGPIEEPDISMAWQDLNRDLRSVVDEADRGRLKADLDGVNARIEGFRSRFESHEVMEATETHWDRLTTALDGLRRRVEGRSS